MALAPTERAAVESALREVYDPELGIDVVSLGLVYDIVESDGRVIVDMTLTTPGCPVSDGLPEEAQEAIDSALAPFEHTGEVRVVWEPPWTVDRISPEAADRLGIGRARIGT